MKRFFAHSTFAVYGYLFFVIALFFYAWTQIDLSLTLSQASVIQTVEKAFQYIGYFNRPLSVELCLLVFIGLYTFYLFILRGIREKVIAEKKVLIIIGIVSVFLSLTYNAFSYDIFNYIFDAKIVTYYQENPYEKKALDFPQDPMLSFMRWTHRVYPYGPIWLALTVPLSYLGMHKFIVTFFLFKFLMLTSFLGTVYFLRKILSHVSSPGKLLGVAFFALSPFVLIESLVSGHNDIVMLFFAVAAFYFLVSKRSILALIFLAVSIGIKFATVFLLPVFLYVLYLSYKKKTINWDQMAFWSLISMGCAVLAVSLRTNFQPWYLLYIFPFAALLPHRRDILVPVTLLSVVALCNYLPFLYVGNWDAPIPTILLWLNTISSILAVVIFLMLRRKPKKVTS